MPEANLFSALILRLGIGFYICLLGLWGYTEPELSLKAVQNYSHLPGWYTSLFISIAPYFLFLAGIFLILGLFTKYTALAAVLLLLPLVYGAGAFAAPEADKLSYFLQKRSLYKDLVVIIGCISLLISGAGAFSADRILKSMYGK